MDSMKGAAAQENAPCVEDQIDVSQLFVHRVIDGELSEEEASNILAREMALAVFDGEQQFRLLYYPDDVETLRTLSRPISFCEYRDAPFDSPPHRPAEDVQAAVGKVDFDEVQRFKNLIDLRETHWCITPVPEGGAGSKSRFLCLTGEFDQRVLQRMSDDVRVNNNGVEAPTAIYIAANRFKISATRKRYVDLESVRVLTADFDFELKENKKNDPSQIKLREILDDLPDRDSRLQYVIDCGFHIVTETSPGHFQAFLLVEEGLLTPLDATDVNRGLAHKFGSDVGAIASVHNMRLPGSWHRKREPFRVRIVHVAKDLTPLSEIPCDPVTGGRRNHFSGDEAGYSVPENVDAKAVFDVLVGPQHRKDRVEKHHDRSEVESSLAAWCMCDGLDIEVFDVVVRYYRSVAGDPQGRMYRDDFVTRTWSWAMEKGFRVSNSPSARMRKRLIDNLMNSSGAGGAGVPPENDIKDGEGEIPDPAAEGFTDDALAQRIANKKAGAYRFIGLRGRHIHFDDDRWRYVQPAAARNIIRMEIRTIADETAMRQVEQATENEARLTEQLGTCLQALETAEKTEKQTKEMKETSAEAAEAYPKAVAEIAQMKDRIRDIKKALTATRKVVAEGKTVLSEGIRSKKKIMDVMALVEGDETVLSNPDEWDTEEEIFGSPNGVWNLRTGEKVEDAYPHRCTLSTKVDPAPSGEQPKRWEKFIYEIMDGDQEMIDYLHRYVGYSLTGYTREECFLFAHGSTRNGKGTMWGLLVELLGDYGRMVDSKLFTMDGANRHAAFLAATVDRRLIVTEEIPDGAVWNQSFIKSYVGGDVQEANEMRGNPFNFTPRASVVMVSNNKPAFHVVNSAIRSRFRFVGYEQSWLGKEDRTLKRTLRQELPEILRWVMDGAKKYLESGLTTPNKVEVDTNGYMREASVVNQWLEDKRITEDDIANGIDLTKKIHWPSIGELKKNYRDFCRHNGYQTLSPTMFRQALDEEGFPEQRKPFNGRVERVRGPFRPLTLSFH